MLTTQLLLICLIGLASTSLPPFITSCPEKSPRFNRCVIRQATRVVRALKKGVPELGIPPIDPLMPKEPVAYTFDVPNLGNFILYLRKFELTGLAKVKLRSIRILPDRGKVKLRLRFPDLYVNADYKILAQLEDMNFDTKGRVAFNFDTVDVALRVTFEEGNGGGYKLPEVLELGRDLLAVKIGAAQINFDQLLEDEALNQALNVLINKNFLPVFKSLKPGIALLLWDVLYNFVQPVLDKIT